MTPTTEQLAREVLAMFELQREYFRTKNQAKLGECKTAEAALKKRCQEILNPRQVQPGLFGEGH